MEPRLYTWNCSYILQKKAIVVICCGSETSVKPSDLVTCMKFNSFTLKEFYLLFTDYGLMEPTIMLLFSAYMLLLVEPE